MAGFVTNVSDAITGATDKGVEKFIKSNPNRYSKFNLLSTAPQSIGKDGSISFSGGPQLATQDLRKVANTVGSTFDDNSPSNKKDKNNKDLTNFDGVKNFINFFIKNSFFHTFS